VIAIDSADDDDDVDDDDGGDDDDGKVSHFSRLAIVILF
jgi:hypothetical protein